MRHFDCIIPLPLAGLECLFALYPTINRRAINRSSCGTMKKTNQRRVIYKSSARFCKSSARALQNRIVICFLIELKIGGEKGSRSAEFTNRTIKKCENNLNSRKNLAKSAALFYIFRENSPSNNENQARRIDRRAFTIDRRAFTSKRGGFTSKHRGKTLKRRDFTLKQRGFTVRYIGNRLDYHYL